MEIEWKYIPGYEGLYKINTNGEIYSLYKNKIMKQCVNHKNEIKTDNSISNLEWCSKAYNNSYNGKDKRSCKPIKQISADGKVMKIWESARQASRELNIQYKNISAVIRRKRNFCGGFRWEYAL